MSSRNPLLEDCQITPEALGSLVDLIDQGKVSGLMAKQTLDKMVQGDQRTPMVRVLLFVNIISSIWISR